MNYYRNHAVPYQKFQQNSAIWLSCSSLCIKNSLDRCLLKFNHVSSKLITCCAERTSNSIEQILLLVIKFPISPGSSSPPIPRHSMLRCARLARLGHASSRADAAMAMHSPSSALLALLGTMLLCRSALALSAPGWAGHITSSPPFSSSLAPIAAASLPLRRHAQPQLAARGDGSASRQARRAARKKRRSTKDESADNAAATSPSEAGPVDAAGADLVDDLSV
eukprot:6173240-Pleurochrysis_carterae.AAC.9